MITPSYGSPQDCSQWSWPEQSRTSCSRDAINFNMGLYRAVRELPHRARKKWQHWLPLPDDLSRGAEQAACQQLEHPCVLGIALAMKGDTALTMITGQQALMVRH
jgi:hypothetical protein